MSKKPDAPKITRRQVDNLRAESMRNAAFQLKRLRMSTLGKPAIEKCECGKEYEVFPNQPTQLTTAQINAIKFDVDKIYPGLVSEELDKATHEPKSINEIYQEFADAILKEENEASIRDFVKKQRDAAEQAKRLLDKYLADNVIPLKIAGNGQG